MAHVFIVTPAGRGSRSGNRHTAGRWAALLRSLGHRCAVATVWSGEPTDVLIALHARRSHDSIARYRKAHPAAPLVVVLTGTDLYRDIRTDADARTSLELADRLVVLQDAGATELPAGLDAKVRVIYQSAQPLARAAPSARQFEVAVIGHLREEKDPFRAALAAGLLPPSSRIRVVHMGRALSDAFEREAQRLMLSEPRYRWLGELPHWRVRRHLKRMQALVVSSRMEGGANVVAEALAAGVPVLASRVSGNVGMLGTDYEGFYPVEDERALAALLSRFETDAPFRARLHTQCAARRPLVDEARERSALATLLAELLP